MNHLSVAFDPLDEIVSDDPDIQRRKKEALALLVQVERIQLDLHKKLDEADRLLGRLRDLHEEGTSE